MQSLDNDGLSRADGGRDGQLAARPEVHQVGVLMGSKKLAQRAPTEVTPRRLI
jgi:hypothetical protein